VNAKRGMRHASMCGGDVLLLVGGQCKHLDRRRGSGWVAVRVQCGHVLPFRQDAFDPPLSLLSLYIYIYINLMADLHACQIGSVYIYTVNEEGGGAGASMEEDRYGGA
jgi:hypothetical protein